MYSRQFDSSAEGYASPERIPPHYHGSAFDPPPVYARDNDRHDPVSPLSEREERQQPRIGEDNACTRGASEQPREETCERTVHRDTDREEEPRRIDEPFADDTPHQAHACKEAVCEKDFSHNACSKPSHAGFLGEDWILPLVLFLMLNNQGGGKLKQLLNFQDGEHTLLLLILAYVFFF